MGQADFVVVYMSFFDDQGCAEISRSGLKDLELLRLEFSTYSCIRVGFGDSTDG